MELPESLESTMKQLNKWKWTIITIYFYLFYIVAVVTVFKPGFWPDEFGFKEDKSVTTTEEKDPQGTTTKKVETTKTDPAKTLWDWLSLLGAPIALAIFGYWLQQIQQERAKEYDRIQQKRADTEAEAQRELAANQTNEDVLQVYFDRLSTLLIDKNLMAIATKVNSGETGIYAAKPEENQLVASAVDVIRARTLSILRRFGDDGKLKASVIRFLIEADFISKLKELYLTDADLTGGIQLSNANLTGAIFSNANLTGAIFTNANLTNANLTNADLSGANLTGANLNGASASLVDAKLNGANLSNADLFKRDLTRTTLNGADLSNANLNGAQLFGTDLSSTKLLGTHLSNAILNGAQLFGTHLSNAILNRAQLVGADLTGAKLIGAKLIGADLTGAILTGADLTGADLTGAYLTGAYLTGADLTDAFLALSPTFSPTFTGAAILTGAKGFSPQQIKSAKNWEAATYNGKRLDDPEVITQLGLDATS